MTREELLNEFDSATRENDGIYIGTDRYLAARCALLAALEPATCKTCVFWEHRTPYHGKTISICELAERHEKEAQRFYVFADSADDTGLESRLETGPDFGCVLHRPR